MGEPQETRSGQTWHHMLLHPSPSSSQLSYVSEIQTDAGSQPSTPLQQPIRFGIFGDADESTTNYDSGNFSLSESGGKEKLAFASVGASGDMHQRFVQLNTELYQTKTELLTYKYKWNEIRNEIELRLTKKIDKLLDEKNEVESELEAVRQEIARLKAHQYDPNGREFLKIRAELDGFKIQLDCKDKANECLKQTIVEQHIEKENLALKVKALEHQIHQGKSEISTVKTTESWFKDELHRCQNANAKLKESYASLEQLLYRERKEKAALVEAARSKLRHLMEEKDDLLRRLNDVNLPRAKETDETEAEQQIQTMPITDKHPTKEELDLLRKHEFLEKQNAELHTVLIQLQDTLQKQQQHIEMLNSKGRDALQDMSSLREQHVFDQTKIETLAAQLARECFTKRQIDVSVEKLKAQVKVLSINIASRVCQRSDVEECESIRRHNQDLQDRCNRLVSEQQMLRGELAMYSESAQKQQDDMLLLDNFRSIQSKNLNLKLKLGQCVSIDKEGYTSGAMSSMEEAMARTSEATVNPLGQDVNEPEYELSQPLAGKRKEPNGRGLKFICPKHGSDCRGNALLTGLTSEEEDDDMRNLRIMLKVIENENRRRLQRYELNNRTLLRKVKEHARERKLAEQRTEELLREHDKCTKLRSEMASTRERCMLMEADLETFKQETATLRSEKERLINLLQNNCLLTNDGDVWGSLKKSFQELHELKQIRKENDRLRDQMERNAQKIGQLESSIDDLKREVDIQTADAADVRSELAVKVAQLEDCQRTIDRLAGDHCSLQQSVSLAEQNEQNLTEKLNDLQRLLQVQEIRLETAHERLKLYEQSELMLASAKDTFFSDLQSLQDAILLEKREKYELEEEVRELRQNMVNAVGNSLQNFHPRDRSADGSGQLSATIMSPDTQSLPMSCTSLDIDHLRALVEESSQKRYSLQPLHDCVSSLKLEMDNLNSVLQIANYPPQLQPPQLHPHQQRFPLSLMEELNDATNGRYGSR
uniref:Uncharacterized protein n=1 Tax=Anopheles dirus TaxID=7168 RepID=A0A182NNG2_9DIPT